MHVLRVRNVNGALPQGIHLLNDMGHWQDSRNGRVRVCPVPVTTLYESPINRVIVNPVRDANPFFHLFESLWMLAGRNDLKYVEQFAANMRTYSDDGETMWGAYGWRWRSFFNGVDQLSWVISRLKKDHNDRRVVLQMWDGETDPGVAEQGGKDVPCNLTAHFQMDPNGALNMTVFNRSNDIIWGAYGANAVHFSILQEYVASMVGVPVGRYWQVSDNFHAYEELYQKMHDEFVKGSGVGWYDPYHRQHIKAYPLVTKPETWDRDLAMFLDEPTAIGFRDPFFRKIAVPMFMAHRAFKENDAPVRYDRAHEILEQMPKDNDWRTAAKEWIDRREAKWKKAQDDGPDYN